MKEERLMEALGEVREEYIAEAAPGSGRRKSRSWIKWGAAAACLCLIVGLGVYGLSSGGGTSDSVSTDHAETSVSTGFVWNGAVYFSMGLEEYQRFGLIDENAEGLTWDDVYRVSEADLGEKLGTVEYDGREVTLYRFAGFPDYDAICVVELAEGHYDLFAADGLLLSDEIGENSDRILEAYGMPQSVTEITVQTGAWETVQTITDPETIAAICELMGGKKNMGLEAHEKLYAQLWYDTYGNEDVYYDEQDGCMHYKSSRTGPVETITDTDEAGNTVVEAVDDGFDDIYEQAHALWGEGERVVWFQTGRGFEFYMIYVPSIRTFSVYGYYSLSESEAAQMNTLLEIS